MSSLIYRKTIAIVDRFVPNKLQPYWNSDAGMLFMCESREINELWTMVRFINNKRSRSLPPRNAIKNWIFWAGHILYLEFQITFSVFAGPKTVFFWGAVVKGVCFDKPNCRDLNVSFEGSGRCWFGGLDPTRWKIERVPIRVSGCNWSHLGALVSRNHPEKLPIICGQLVRRNYKRISILPGHPVSWWSCEFLLNSSCFAVTNARWARKRNNPALKIKRRQIRTIRGRSRRGNPRITPFLFRPHNFRLQFFRNQPRELTPTISVSLPSLAFPNLLTKRRSRGVFSVRFLSVRNYLPRRWSWSLLNNGSYPIIIHYALPSLYLNCIYKLQKPTYKFKIPIACL